MWRTILRQLDDLLADPYLAAHQDDFARHALTKLLADPSASIEAIAAEYRTAKDLWTHDEHHDYIEQAHAVRVALKGKGMKDEQIAAVIKAQFPDL